MVLPSRPRSRTHSKSYANLTHGLSGLLPRHLEVPWTSAKDHHDILRGSHPGMVLLLMAALLNAIDT